MPQYNAQINYELKRDGVYKILCVDEVTTQTNKHYLKVSCTSQDKNDLRNYVAVLWPNDEVQATSAFGSFVSVFGNDTDKWWNKWFKVIRWETKFHEIFPVSMPREELIEEAEKLTEEARIDISKKSKGK